jgi:hypothetical protein
VREGKSEDLISNYQNGNRRCGARGGRCGDLCGDRGDCGTGGVGVELGGENSVARGLANYGLGVEGKAAVLCQSTDADVTIYPNRDIHRTAYRAQIIVIRRTGRDRVGRKRRDHNGPFIDWYNDCACGSCRRYR